MTLAVKGWMTRNRRLPGRISAARLGAAYLILAVAGPLAGCAGGGGEEALETTCEEYLDMGGELSMTDPLSQEQRELLEDALKARDLDPGEMNVLTAGTRLIQYCGPDSTGTRPNEDEPIGNAITDD